MCTQSAPLAELVYQAFDDPAELGRQDHLLERRTWLEHLQQFELVAPFWKRTKSRYLQRSRPRAGLPEDRLQLARQEVVALAPLILDESLGG
jgi:hypothetical protein